MPVVYYLAPNWWDYSAKSLFLYFSFVKTLCAGPKNMYGSGYSGQSKNLVLKTSILKGLTWMARNFAS